MNPVKVTYSINGDQVTISSLPNRSLLEVLREDMGLTGVKDSCGGKGECGACTVIMDGEAVNSCMVLIGQVHDHEVETIEGLARDGELHPLQKAFVEAGAVQCGYCTPGAIMSAKALLEMIPSPSNDEIREALSGNLCRCTGYTKMVEAVRRAAKEFNNAR